MINREAIIAGLVAIAVGFLVTFVGLHVIDSHHPAPTRTQVVAVCDSRGNTVYTTSTGGIYVLEGCR